ncbi:MAG TPA: DinB family protein [Gemmatimonadaceae bacterium]|nr:DinB family protein [Gemmatimonadaceae bacterium]
MKRLLLVPLIFVGAPVFAQATTARSAAPPATNPGVTSARMLWSDITGFVTRAAEQIPEADYAFKPTPQVRTLGELIGHIAGAQNMICAAALNEPQKSEDDIEKNVKTKAGLVAALKASTEYCGRAYAQSDAASAGSTKLFGQDRSRMYALMINATHNGEHYGNMVTYMRIKGMVPPSSQQGPPPPPAK